MLLQKQARLRGYNTKLVHAVEFPIHDGKQNSSMNNNLVQSFRDDVRRANVVVVGSPTYNMTYSGVFKNAMDYLKPGDFNENTPVGIVSTSGGPGGAAVTAMHMRTVFPIFNVIVMPSYCAIGGSWRVFDQNGNVKAEEEPTAKRIDTFGVKLFNFADILFGFNNMKRKSSSNGRGSKEAVSYTHLTLPTN